MNTTPAKSKTVYLTTYTLYLLFFASLIFSLRAVSSISIAAILLIGIIASRSVLSSVFQKNYRTYFLLASALFFLLQVTSLLYTEDVERGWSNIRIKTGLLITPLAVCLSRCIDAAMLKRLLSHYCLLLAAASMFCLVINFFSYRESSNDALFFYHSLVRPISQHAVYFSLLVLTGLIFLLESIKKNDFFISRSFHLCLIIYLSIFLLLLSSKLVIFFYLVYVLSGFIIMLKKNKVPRVTVMSLFTFIILGFILILAVPNPVSRRFYEIMKGDIKIITQEKFKPGDYFNGLQFRLLQWKFVTEILAENKRWLFGVSPGDAQSYLNEKYLSKNMYSGDPAKGTRGYLVYNTHNQFLQTTLQNGIMGLLFLIAVCFCMLKIAINHNSRLTIFITLVLLVWLFAESAFETQYGIMIFTFFPIFLTTADIFRKEIESPTF